jgi:Ca-activated chloride channel family protein
VNNFSATGWPYLALLLLLPAGWWWMRRHRVRLPYPNPRRLKSSGRSASRLWWHWPTVLRSVALLLVAVALVQPVRLWERVEAEREGVAIMLAVDISSSMLAEDFRPDNRIEVAKREVIRFVEGRESDWIGLVAFAGEALTMVPGTLDHAVVETAVESLEAGQLRDGTAIGVALATAANRLRELEPESRIVVLLTDGDNNSGSISPEEATAAAASLGIRIYTIGVGRDGVAPVPVARTAFGYQYANVRVHVNDELLEQMATSTGGLYFRATEPEGLMRIYERINELETTPLREVRTVERVGLRRELLLLALGALLLELLGSATRARRVWA